MKLIGAVLLGVVLGALGTNAFQGMPVEYVICDLAGANCQVTARFKDHPDCEFHRKFMGALCTDNPADLSAVCKFGRPSLLTTTRCQ